MQKIQIQWKGPVRLGDDGAEGKIPDGGGIYIWLYEPKGTGDTLVVDRITYIGESCDLRARTRQHIINTAGLAYTTLDLRNGKTAYQALGADKELEKLGAGEGVDFPPDDEERFRLLHERQQLELHARWERAISYLLKTGVIFGIIEKSHHGYLTQVEGGILDALRTKRRYKVTNRSNDLAIGHISKYPAEDFHVVSSDNSDPDAKDMANSILKYALGHEMIIKPA